MTQLFCLYYQPQGIITLGLYSFPVPPRVGGWVE